MHVVAMDKSRGYETVVLPSSLNLIRIHHEPRLDITSAKGDETYHNGYSNNDIGDRHSCRYSDYFDV
jgi:hypothetical protein